jgi:hypothetical protein
MKLFDYIFYRVCQAYAKTSEKTPEWSASIVVSLMQAFNIISVVMLLGLIIQKKSILNTGIGIFTLLTLYVINYIRYIYKENNNYQVLKLRWENEQFQFRNGILAFIYIILSTLCFLILAII